MFIHICFKKEEFKGKFSLWLFGIIGSYLVLSGLVLVVHTVTQASWGGRGDEGGYNGF